LNDRRFGWSESPADSFKRAIELAQQAAPLDETVPDYHSLLGQIHLFQGQHEQAIKAGQRALDLGPNDDMSCALLAHNLYYTGRFDEVIPLIQKAMRLNPHYPYWYLIFLAGSYRYLDRLEDAIDTCKHLLERERGTESEFWPHSMLASIYGELGRQEEARFHAAELPRTNPNFSLAWMSTTAFFKNPAHLERILDGLRKAGLE
jgi:tetratricopeptide (TPR) repeat protein